VTSIVRGDDGPALLTLPLRAEVHAKAARVVAVGIVERGCADGSLYRRFPSAGLIQVRKLSQLAVYDDASSVIAQDSQSPIMSTLTPDETDEWRAAVAQAETSGGFVLGIPYHGAVATKP